MMELLKYPQVNNVKTNFCLNYKRKRNDEKYFFTENPEAE